MEASALEPILAVRDVARAIAYYRDVLGGERAWTYLDPPDHGGISIGRFQIQFSRDPALAERCEGAALFIRVDDVAGFEARHRAAGAEIVASLEAKPWGLSEYVVRDVDGYRLRFAGTAAYVKSSDAPATMPADYRVEVRTPGVAEFGRLKDEVGWARGGDDPSLADVLARSMFCVVATRDDHVVGMLRITGDGHFFMVWDVMVRPADQGRRVGSEMMKVAIAHLRTLAEPGRFVGLFSGKPLFYERLGFQKDVGLHRPL